MRFFVSGFGRTNLSICAHTDNFVDVISETICIDRDLFYITSVGGRKIDYVDEGDTICIKFRGKGGIDFQHREGSKIGSGGLLSESQAALERKERLRKLALETIDISKDPYIMRNNLGTYECKLCLTLHNNEGNYLAHTQGKRHQVITMHLI